VTLTISHEKTREITREEVDRAIDVIERHLEKEARTRNLLDEQAIMRPKDLCKQQGLDMVAEPRYTRARSRAYEGGCTVKASRVSTGGPAGCPSPFA
jgi:hypothetical protein